MYSLHVGVSEGAILGDRLFEFTDDALRERFAANISELQSLPVLAMPEIGDERHEQVAHIGVAVAVKRHSREVRFKFVRDNRFLPLPLDTIEALAPQLRISHWEFRRTHWAVKDVDLFETLLAYELDANGDRGAASAVDSAARFMVDAPQEHDLVAVMTPYDPQFDVVFETLQAATSALGLRAVRAKDIWDHPEIMDDVRSLLWRARVVIADLTGRNPNVFYETGLAHALPRPTILITQNPSDVPFDLRSVRYLHYGVGTQARTELRTKLTEKLASLMT